MPKQVFTVIRHGALRVVGWCGDEWSGPVPEPDFGLDRLDYRPPWLEHSVKKYDIGSFEQRQQSR